MGRCAGGREEGRRHSSLLAQNSLAQLHDWPAHGGPSVWRLAGGLQESLGGWPGWRAGTADGRVVFLEVGLRKWQPWDPSVLNRSYFCAHARSPWGAAEILKWWGESL